MRLGRRWPLTGASQEEALLINTVFRLPARAGACPLEENLERGRACFFPPGIHGEAHRVELSLRLGRVQMPSHDKRGGQQMGRLALSTLPKL